MGWGLTPYVFRCLGGGCPGVTPAEWFVAISGLVLAYGLLFYIVLWSLGLIPRK